LRLLKSFKIQKQAMWFFKLFENLKDFKVYLTKQSEVTIEIKGVKELRCEFSKTKDVNKIFEIIKKF